MQSYEVVVVGAGPAGSTAAHQLAKNGVRTLLVEKEDLPRSKTGSGVLSVDVLRFNNRIFGRNLAYYKDRNIINNSVDQIQLVVPGSAQVSFTTSEPLYFAERKDYDFSLFQEAKKEGIDFLINDGVRHVHPRRNILETQSGKEILFEYLFAADGINSKIRQSVLESQKPSSTRWKNNLAIGLETRIPAESLPAPHQTGEWAGVYLGILEWGFGWILPHSTKTFVGVGGLKSKNPDIRTRFEEFLELLNVNSADYEIEGHPFPMGNYSRFPFYENILFIGDAGGFADPLTGEGIYYGQRTGKLAAQAYWNSKKSSVGKEYSKMVQKKIIPDYTGAERLRPFVYGSPACIQGMLLNLISPFLNPKTIRNLTYNPPLNCSLPFIK